MDITCAPIVDRTYRVGRDPVILCPDCGAVVPVATRGDAAVVPAHPRRG